MPRIVFTPHLKRHLKCPEVEVRAATVRQALDAVFAANPTLQGYVLDDQQRVRRHVVIFVDGATLRDRDNLSDPVSDKSEIYVMQALSGG